jgi:hypothetical protein
MNSEHLVGLTNVSVAFLLVSRQESWQRVLFGTCQNSVNRGHFWFIQMTQGLRHYKDFEHHFCICNAFRLRVIHLCSCFEPCLSTKPHVDMRFGVKDEHLQNFSFSKERTVPVLFPTSRELETKKYLGTADQSNACLKTAAFAFL